MLVELTSLICRIDLFGLTVTHVDMYPYLAENITISNVDKLKIIITVSYIPKTPAVGHHCSWPPSTPSILQFVPMSCMGPCITYLSYAHVLPCTIIFSVETHVGMPAYMSMPLVEMSRHVLLCTPILSVENTLISIEMSMYVLPWASIHVLPREYFLIIPCVFLSMHMLPQESVHEPPQGSMLVVAVPHVYISFCPTLCTSLMMLYKSVQPSFISELEIDSK